MPVPRTKNKFRDLSDQDLVDQLLNGGNEIYFSEIYRRYFSKVYYQVISYVKNATEAEDVTQSIFLKLHDRISRFEGKSSFSTWLYALARNACLDHLRKSGKEIVQTAPEESMPDIPETDDSELLQIRADMLSLVLDRLSPDDKSMLIMKYAHEWQVEGIAEYFGLGSSAVKMRLKRAKFKAKQIFEELSLK